MPFCPHCRIEYREGFTYCYDCDVYLVDSLEDSPPEEEPREKDENWEFLANIPTQEAGLVEGIFELHEIPLLKKYQHSGEMLNLYMGDSFTGVDLYVPSLRLDDARDIIENMRNSQLETGEEDEEDEEITDSPQSGTITLVIGLVVIALVIALMARAF